MNTFFQANTLADRIEALCEIRGVPNYFHAFSQAQVFSGDIPIHIDWIAPKNAKASLIFMPGTNAYTLLYGEFLTEMAGKGYNVIAFDPRGHGQSGGDRGSYTIADLLADYRAVFEFVKREFEGPIIASGSSQGGITAFYFAAQTPEVEAVICHNFADLDDPKSVALTRFPEWVGSFRSVLTAFSWMLPELPVPMNSYLDLSKEPVRGFQSAKEILEKDPLIPTNIRLKGLASLGYAPFKLDFTKVQTPTMVLQAGKDSIFPTWYIQELFAKIPSSKRLKIYPELYHYMIADNVSVFIDDVDEWLKEVL